MGFGGKLGVHSGYIRGTYGGTLPRRLTTTDRDMLRTMGIREDTNTQKQRVEGQDLEAIDLYNTIPAHTTTTTTQNKKRVSLVQFFL